MYKRQLLDTELGGGLESRFLAFDIVHDPAYLTVDLDDSESGFETILRENPFHGNAAANATSVVGLCQDHLDDGSSRLATLVESTADREGRATPTVAEDWFRQYLELLIRPVLWLYLERELGIRAHQQNSMLTLNGGYPETFRYRDNQGYYLPESTYDEVDAFLSGIDERADMVCPDAVTDERIRYYVVINNVFGLVNTFGTAGLVGERRLLSVLRDKLESLREYDRPSSLLLDDLLTNPTIPCKANLLMQFHDMGELEGSLTNQPMYADIDNPLITELEIPAP